MLVFKKQIDLGQVRTDEDAKVFAGRTRGKRCRDFFKLDEFDQVKDAHVLIRVPEDTLAVTTSFLLSFLGPSMVRAGSEEAFSQKFSFTCPEYIRPSITEGLERALRPEGMDAVSTALGSHARR